MMKKRLYVSLLISICIVAVSGVAFGLPEQEPPVVNITREPAARTVTVIGSGIVQARPDIATVRIGVESMATDIDEALLENRTILSRIVADLIELGIAQDDIQTSNYSFNFDRQSTEVVPSRAAQTTRYYRVNNMLTVNIRDLAKTADIIDAAVVSGANQMWGVEFDVADRESLDREALIAASLDARERAQFIADLSELDLGEILSVSEVIGASYGSSVLRAEAMSSMATNVHPGLIRFSAQIQVVYSLVED